MKRPCLFSSILLLITSLVAHAQPVVSVEGGRISGSTNANIHSFKGIPFAAPPVGVLRWKAPQPVLPWPGIRRCDAFGPSPMQGTPNPFGPWSAEFLIPKTPISEDCLYLNVWTGANLPAAKLAAPLRPVLVWVYGGGFNSGGSGCAIYDGEATAQKGIVVVSFNYRVGPFGFFAHPELTRESGRNASGNYGLMDQIAALQWVKKNIAAFGGDPNNVTVAGQSAGAMSVNCLVASPVAKHLFQKAIAESGASFATPYPTLQQGEAAGLKMAEALGASSLAELRATSADDILKKAQGRGPITDGYILPESVAAIFAAKRQNDVTLLTGWNEDEGVRFGAMKNAADYRRQIEEQYGSKASDVLAHYPGQTDSEAAASQARLGRDLIFGAQNYRWANTQSEQGKTVYVYRFSRKIPAVGEYAPYGAFHTGEVAYVFDNLRFIDRSLRPLQPADEQLANTMAQYWANFIKTGNPNGRNLPQWPPYSVNTKKIMLFDTHVRSEVLPDAAALDALFSAIKR